ncbi:hypothetical protein [Succinimonas sp.]|uniref:hypothetical protein n=1 Tax=Succinimonas sp. TaxID=1936151 RepID=UPI0038657420
MGEKDTAAKHYFANDAFFADAFNFFLFSGKKVIKPEELSPMDSTEAARIFGEKSSTSVQRHRDLLKLWGARENEDAVFMLLGLELQSTVHYGMTARNMLYDALSYATQISDIKRLRKRQKSKNAENTGNNDNSGNNDDAELTCENGVVTIRMTDSAEFLSGMKKDDKLKPVITLVLNLSGKPWDGPVELHEILNVKNRELLQYINNYRLNIFSPAEIEDDDFKKFSTACGFALKVVKHQNDAGLADVIKKQKSTDTETADFISAFIKHKKIFQEKDTNEVNMMNGLDLWGQKLQVLAVIKAFKNIGQTDEYIVDYVVANYQVTPDYVMKLIQEWHDSIQLQEQSKAPNPSIPAGS